MTPQAQDDRQREAGAEAAPAETPEPGPFAVLMFLAPAAVTLAMGLDARTPGWALAAICLTWSLFIVPVGLFRLDDLLRFRSRGRRRRGP